MNDPIHNNFLRLPPDKRKLLLHSCCAPCSCGIIKTLKESNIHFSVFFYNPNIDPLEEYNKRKDENKRYADKLDVEFFDSDHDIDFWNRNVSGLENEPERGKRCSVCFYLRLKRTAEFAVVNGYDIITSSLGISRWKNFEQVATYGKEAAAELNLAYWDINWRKNDGTTLMSEITTAESFYRQNYCGCKYSR